MPPKFEQFIKKRLYLHNVSPATVSWYTHNFKWMPSESPTEDALKAMVVRMREKGLRATGCVNGRSWRIQDRRIFGSNGRYSRCTL